LPLRISQPVRPVILWMLVLGLGVALLYLRYDWDLEGGRFAKRGFVLSTYLFLIALPTCFYLAREILRHTYAAVVVTGFLFVLATVPYELLGLDQIYYYRVRPRVFTIAQFPPSLEFFPGGSLRAFPFDWLFMPLLFATGAALIWGVWWLRKRAGFTAARTVPVLLTIAFGAICVQAFVHSSMRAPYTYLAYFQRPEAEQHWYHVYHFADGSGASEGDQFAFSPLEEYFQGAPSDGDNELIRRPFSFYLASQVSYFVNSYYVWLGLNCLFWLAAVVATGRLVEQLATPRAGVIAAALTTVAPGFVAFVATPAMYLQNYAAVAIALYLFQTLVVRPAGRELGKVALFTGAFTVCALVYDLTPFFLVLAAYGLARRVRRLPLLVSLVAAFLVTRGFPLLVTHVLDTPINPANEAQLSIAFDRFETFVLHPSLSGWYDAAVTIVPSYVRQLLLAFFVIPLVVAAFGLRKLHDPALRVLVGAWFAITFAATGVLLIGEMEIGRLPRLLFPLFPAVYLLAALALDPTGRTRRLADAPRRVRVVETVRLAAPWVVVGVMAVLANIDILGYPTLYVEYFVNDPPAFLPR
jgi:hypothetical protein